MARRLCSLAALLALATNPATPSSGPAAPPSPPPLTKGVRYGWVASLGTGALKDIKYSHMPTIAALPDGTLAAAFQCTTSIEGAPDQHIRLATSKDGARTWSEPLPVVGHDSHAAVWGPVLFVDEISGRLLLFYSLSHPGTGTAKVGGSLHYVSSVDNGLSFGAPTTILELGNISKVTANRVAVVGGTGSGTTGGDWLLPFWYEGEPPTGAASVLVSSDRGKSWRPHGFIHGTKTATNDTKVIENSLAPMPNGKAVLQIYRAGKPVLFSSVSDHAAGGSSSSPAPGLEWSAPAMPTTIMNPSAKASIFARNDTGAIVLSYNPSTTLRSPLSLAESVSGAVEAFTHLATLENDVKKSFAYPTSLLATYGPATATAGAGAEEGNNEQKEKASKASIHTVYSVYDPKATAPHVHHWWGIRIATLDVQ